MSSIVIYDSVFGNTAEIAAAVAAVLQQAGGCRLLRVRDATAADLTGQSLVVIASPTQAFHPLPSVTAFLDGLPAGSIAGRTFAVFDTRVALEDIPSRPLRWAVKVGGFAADHLARRLGRRNATVVGEPKGFEVAGREGPLKPGERERAVVWANGLAESLRLPGAA